MVNVTCPVCSAKNLTEAKFCDDCGTSLIAVSPREPKRGIIGSAADKWTIGSAADCDIRVEQPAVSGHHCRLSYKNDQFLLEDLGSTNGTFVNGLRIEGKVQVTPEDVITLGMSARLPWPPTGNGASGAAARIIRIGRDADNDVVLDYPMISGHHARILLSGGPAVIEDLGSTNGIAIGNPENKATRSRLSESDTVYFGSFPIPAARLLGKVSLGEKPHTSLSFKGLVMVLGRDPDCDQVLDHPMISWHHARLTRSHTAYTVEDLGSTNGTYVNGERISGIVPVRVGDRIGLGSYTFVFTVEGTIEQRDYRGNVTIEARDVTVAVGRQHKKLIEDVSLTIYPSEIVALMGPSGAGKTTLMNALNGYTPLASGTVLINGQNLYQNYGQFCGHLGYVPQDDIMHRDLTVKQALYYTARLRLPSDYSRADIEKRIADVMEKLSLKGTEDVIIGSPERKGISGGQRKRVNLAMELLTDPSVLFLDEPTSGLASEDAYNVMKVLRNLADAGKTILITIHQPSLEVFRMMDSLILINKDEGAVDPGRMVYFGPAYPDSIEFFNPNGTVSDSRRLGPSPDAVLHALMHGKTADWLARYHASRYKRKYVDERAGKRPAGSVNQVTPKIKREINLSQWWTLVRRNFAIKVKDKWNTALLLLLAPLIGSLVVFTLGKKAGTEAISAIAPEPFLKTTYTIFFVIVSAIFLGCWNALREIVSEWAIYHRERMVNLKIPSYIASKFTVLGGLLGLVQCPILLAIVYFGSGLKGPFLLMLGVMILTGLVALAIGLIISSLVRTSEAATTVAILIMILMILMAGAIVQAHLKGEDARPITFIVASRWGFEALLLLESDARGAWQQTPYSPDNQPAEAETKTMAGRFFPDDQRAGIVTSVGVLLVMLACLTGGMMLVLRLRDVH
ncbi:MAG: hypothetical protein V7641_571 [Blastocatellia bacterium]